MTVLEVGQELIEAKAEHRGEFMRWVEEELPFGIDRAERLMATARAFGGEAEVIEHLPSAWTAMFELTKVPIGALQTSIANGEVHPQMTVAQAREYVAQQKENDRTERHRDPAPAVDQTRQFATSHALAMLRYHPQDLPEEIRWKISRWLRDGSTPTGEATSSPSSSPTAPSLPVE